MTKLQQQGKIHIVVVEARVFSASTEDFTGIEEELNGAIGNREVVFVQQINAASPGNLKFLCIVRDWGNNA